MLGILQQLMSSSPQMGAIKQMMNMVRSAKDPQAALNMMAMNNPQLKQVMDIVQQYGGDSMTAFKALAKENGMDPDEILSMLK